MKIKYLIILLLFISCAQKPKVPATPDYKHSLDAHMHIHKTEGEDDMEFHAANALFAARSIDIQRAIVLSSAYYKNTTKEYARNHNSFVANEVRKNRSKLAGACAVNPLKDWAIEEMNKCAKEGLEVLKLHPMAAGLDVRNPDHQKELKKILTHAEKLNFTVLIHGHLPKQYEAEETLQTLQEFPNLRIIIGHAMGRDFHHLKNFKHPNFFVEMSIAPIWTKTPEDKQKLSSVIREVGVDKFIFGSDWPVIHPAETLKAIRELPLTEEEKVKIVYTNASALKDLFE